MHSLGANAPSQVPTSEAAHYAGGSRPYMQSGCCCLQAWIMPLAGLFGWRLSHIKCCQLHSLTDKRQATGNNPLCREGLAILMQSMMTLQVMSLRQQLKLCNAKLQTAEGKYATHAGSMAMAQSRAEVAEKATQQAQAGLTKLQVRPVKPYQTSSQDTDDIPIFPSKAASEIKKEQLRVLYPVSSNRLVYLFAGCTACLKVNVAGKIGKHPGCCGKL